MKVLFITAYVLGDAGANAAEIFPRLSVLAPEISHVYVADFAKNRDFIRERQHAEFLMLRKKGGYLVSTLRNALRIAKKTKDNNIDVIHVFYRQRNILLVILLRIALFVLGSKAVIIVDHRSVNLARGYQAAVKKLGNLAMQLFTHHLAGNPWAVETNHYFIFRPKHIIDLGYDKLPDGGAVEPPKDAPVNIWFIGSLRPKNRKSEFLIEVFDLLDQRVSQDRNQEKPVIIHVAGPARKGQTKALSENKSVVYHGKLPRPKLYRLLRQKPGVGIAFMNMEFHAFAPSLKFCEYAIMRYRIVASDTLGLRTQARRMNLDDVTFAAESAPEWADKLMAQAKEWNGLQPEWAEASLWAYDSIFKRQVIGLYENITTKKI